MNEPRVAACLHIATWLLLASGCSGTSGTSTDTGGAGGVSATGGTNNKGGAFDVLLPTANGAFDYQIGGAYTPPTGVQVVSRDRNGASALGLYNICYVNGYQLQPAEESFWTTQRPTLVLRDTSGNPVVDADWGEMLLDTSNGFQAGCSTYPELSIVLLDLNVSTHSNSSYVYEGC